MRAAIDAVTGRVSMYRLTVLALAAVLVMGVVLGAVDVIGVDPLGLLGVIGVVLVATIGANEVAARLARVVPHRESSIITALIIACLVPPQATTMSLIGAAAAGVIAALSKYLIVWRGRHIVNPAATGVLVAGLLRAHGRHLVDRAPPRCSPSSRSAPCCCSTARGGSTSVSSSSPSPPSFTSAAASRSGSPPSTRSPTPCC